MKSATSTELTIYWELAKEEVVYLVEVKGVRHRDSARELVQFDVDNFNTTMTQATINRGLGIAKLMIIKLLYLPYVPCNAV